MYPNEYYPNRLELDESEEPRQGLEVLRLSESHERRQLRGVMAAVFFTALVVIGVAVVSSVSAASSKVAEIAATPILSLLAGAFGFYFASRTDDRSRELRRLRPAGTSTVGGEAPAEDILRAAALLDESQGEVTRIAALRLLGSIGSTKPATADLCASIIGAAVRRVGSPPMAMEPAEATAAVTALSEINRTGSLNAPFNLSNLDLSGLDLSGLWLVRAKLGGTSLAGADLSGTNLTEAELRGADLAGCSAVRSSFRYAVLEGANLSGASLTEADFTGALLTHVNLSHADLSGAVLRRALLAGANLSAADARGADFAEALLVESNLSGTILVGAKFAGSAVDDAQAGAVRGADASSGDESVVVSEASELAAWAVRRGASRDIP